MKYNYQMAKVSGPLYSVSATGRVGDVVRFAPGTVGHIARSKKTGQAVQGIQQRRQASLIAEAGRIWLKRGGNGPEANYNLYISAVSAQSWFYVSKDILLEWTEDRLMPIF